MLQQHHTHWIETGCPGAGNILIFNNGLGRGYSSIDEIVPPLDPAGSYSITAGSAFGPSALAWTYVSTPPTNFYSAEISGAQRLPNGNTLICEGVKGNLFEVTTAGQIVWQYLCPVTTEVLTQGDTVPADPAHADQFMNAVFRVTRYALDYPGLVGRDLSSQGTLELSADQEPEIVGIAATASGLELSWISWPARSYAVEYKNMLSASTWTKIATVSATSSLTRFLDASSDRLSQRQGFYRVSLQP